MSHDNTGSTWGALLSEWGSAFDTWANPFATELATAIKTHARGKSYARKMRLRVEERNKLFFKEAQSPTLVRDEVVYDIAKLYEILGITKDIISFKKLKENIKNALWKRLLSEAKKNGDRIKLIKNKKVYQFSGGILKTRPVNTTDFHQINESYSGFLNNPNAQNKVLKEQREYKFKIKFLELIEQYKPSVKTIKNILIERYSKKKKPLTENKITTADEMIESMWKKKPDTVKLKNLLKKSKS